MPIKNFDDIVSSKSHSIWFKTLSACDCVEIECQCSGSVISHCSVNFIEKTDYKHKYSQKMLWQKETFYNEVFEHTRKMWGSAMAWTIIINSNTQNLIQNTQLLSFVRKQRHKIKLYYTIQIPKSNLIDERNAVFIRMLLEVLNNKAKDGIVEKVKLQVI